MVTMRPIALAAVLVICGCQKPQPSDPAPVTGQPTAQQSGTPGGGGVAPIGSGAAGGLTPVTGAENVGGSGMGGVGSAAKGMAQRAAGAAGSAGVSQPSGEGDGD